MGALVLMRMVGRSGVKISILDVSHARMQSAGRSHRRPERHAGRFEVKEPGETDMTSMALATLDLVTHDDAQPAFPAVHLGGHSVLSCGELVGNTAAVISALGLTAAVRAPATLGIWPARCANCPAGQR